MRSLDSDVVSPYGYFREIKSKIAVTPFANGTIWKTEENNFSGNIIFCDM